MELCLEGRWWISIAGKREVGREERKEVSKEGGREGELGGLKQKNRELFVWRRK